MIMKEYLIDTEEVIKVLILWLRRYQQRYPLYDRRMNVMWDMTTMQPPMGKTLFPVLQKIINAGW